MTLTFANCGLPVIFFSNMLVVTDYFTILIAFYLFSGKYLNFIKFEIISNLISTRGIWLYMKNLSKKINRYCYELQASIFYSKLKCYDINTQLKK
jgi:hypothetical protein